MGRKAKDANGAPKKRGRPKKQAALNLGHNKPELTDDEKRALFLHHKGLFEKAKAGEAAAQAERKRVEAKAKAECGKEAVADIKTAIELEAINGKTALTAEIERKHRVARWIGLPVGAQPSFFETDRRPSDETAYDDGKAAGMAGEPRKPPQGTIDARWIDGWNDGQAILASAFGKVDPAKAPKAEKTADPPKGTTSVADAVNAATADDEMRAPAEA